MSLDVGSLAWGEQTGGQLSRSEQLALLIRSLPELVVLGRSRLLLEIGSRQSGIALGPEVVQLPPTPLAAAVKELAERHYRDLDLRNHVYRTAAFADAIRVSKGIEVDRGLLCCACLLHDLELERPVEARCFAVRSAQLARQIVLAAGAPAESAELVADAICRHPTPRLDPERHPLAYLVAAGALVDVTGWRLERFEPQSVSQLLHKWPRGRFSWLLADLWRAEAKAVPRGRARVASRLGFTVATRHAPFPKPADDRQAR